MILHVACMPFPSHQGTQASIAAMVQASTGRGESVALLTYAHGGQELDLPWPVYRVPDFPRVRSLRSGPSVGKAILDLRAIASIRRLSKQARPRAIVAHHIEAAIAALLSRSAPVYYVAHTSLERELPTYLPGLPKRQVARIAGELERAVCNTSAGVAAVAPSLAELLGGPSRYLPVPWRPASAPAPPRDEARAALGLDPGAAICLYAGNLDAYQGWEHLIEAISVMKTKRRRARLLIATESDPEPARAAAARQGVVDSVDFRSLGGERARALAHAASDLAWIPRRTPGGLPIKMLDALARRLPVVAMERATAGLDVAQACLVATDDDAGALAEAAIATLEDPGAASVRTEAGARYLETRHSEQSYRDALHRLLTDRSRPRGVNISAKARFFGSVENRASTLFLPTRVGRTTWSPTWTNRFHTPKNGPIPVFSICSSGRSWISRRPRWRT